MFSSLLWLSFVKTLEMNLFSKNNLILLRLHFSFFLLPVFLFAVSQSENQDVRKSFLLFFLLHFLVYPASNGYNSFMDQDESPIGGLKNPPKADKSLFYLTIILDIVACLIAAYVGWRTMLLVAIYIFASRAYSFRGIRLKQYPIIGFLTVAFFQGAFTYFLTAFSISTSFQFQHHIWAIISSTLLLGGIYPMTQIYQHDADLKDGVVTLSYKLGFIGTFVFCAISFMLAMASMYLHFTTKNELNSFITIQLFLFPVVVFFVYWFVKVWKNTSYANFENTMKMNLIASLCLNACFFFLVIS